LGAGGGRPGGLNRHFAIYDLPPRDPSLGSFLLVWLTAHSSRQEASAGPSEHVGVILRFPLTETIMQAMLHPKLQAFFVPYQQAAETPEALWLFLCPRALIASTGIPRQFRIIPSGKGESKWQEVL
jgi:hypothetical protein